MSFFELDSLKETQRQQIVIIHDENVRYHQLTIAAENNVIRKLLEEDFLDRIAAGDVELHHSIKAKVSRILEKRDCKTPYVLITVNPKADIDFSLLKLQVEKASKKKWIKAFRYAFEQRASCDPYSGIHCHIIIDRGKKRPSGLKTEFQNTFKNVCDVFNPHCLNFKWFPAEALLDKMKYLEGSKCKKKEATVAADKLWRKSLNLSPYYESASPLTCRDA